MNQPLQIFKNKLRNQITLGISFIISIFFISDLNAQQVSTYAGTGNYGSINGTTTTCEFKGPEQMAYDSHNNLLIADHQNHIIKKIDSLGNVTTFVGTGVAGYLDGPISVAQLNNPIGIAIDKFDNVYIADNSNYVIRKVDTAGNVSTYAGSGIQGYLDGNSTVAQFNQINYMCFDDSMNLYVADPINHVIRRIDTLNNVNTFVGNGVPGFTDGTGSLASLNSPISITYNKLKQVFYVSDQGNCAIRKVTLAGVVTTIAGNGLPGYQDGNGALAMFNFPKGITTDSIGNIYVAGRLDYTIRKIDTLNNVTTVAGISGVSGYVDGNVSTALFGRPVSVLMNSDGNILVSDWSNFVIRNVLLEDDPLSTIEQGEREEKVSVFPNPAHDFINFKFLTPLENFEIEIVNLAGQKVHNQSFSSSQDIRINLQDQLPGIFFAKVFTSDRVSVIKFIIQ